MCQTDECKNTNKNNKKPPNKCFFCDILPHANTGRWRQKSENLTLVWVKQKIKPRSKIITILMVLPDARRYPGNGNFFRVLLNKNPQSAGYVLTVTCSKVEAKSKRHFRFTCLFNTLSGPMLDRECWSSGLGIFGMSSYSQGKYFVGSESSYTC